MAETVKKLVDIYECVNCGKKVEVPQEHSSLIACGECEGELEFVESDSYQVASE